MKILGYSADGVPRLLHAGAEEEARATAALHPGLEVFVLDGSIHEGLLFLGAAPSLEVAREALARL